MGADVSKDLALSGKKGGKGGGLARPGAHGGGAPAPDPGQGISVKEVTFTAKGYTYDSDIPKTFRKGAAESTALALRAKGKKSATGSGTLAVYDKKAAEANVVSPRTAAEQAKIEATVIASGARQLEKPRRSMGRIVQRRVGWQATPTLIVITTAERELTKGDDGKMRPSGEWLIEHRKTYRNLDGAAEKRVGNVLADDAEPEDQTVRAAAPGDARPQATPAPTPQPTPASAQDSFPEGTFALSFLPRAVRSSVIARVPAPTVFDGTSLQFSHPQTGEVDRLEVNVIRMDERRAVVVQARRKPDGREWEVSQATYSLGEPEIEQV